MPRTEKRTLLSLRDSGDGQVYYFGGRPSSYKKWIEPNAGSLSQKMAVENDGLLRLGFLGDPAGLTPAQRNSIQQLLAVTIFTELWIADDIGSTTDMMILCRNAQTERRRPFRVIKAGDGLPKIEQRIELLMGCVELLIVSASEEDDSVLARSIRIAAMEEMPRFIVWANGIIQQHDIPEPLE